MVSKDIKICKICLIVSIDFCALTNFFFFTCLFLFFLKTTKVTSHKLHLPKEKKTGKRLKKKVMKQGMKNNRSRRQTKAECRGGKREETVIFSYTRTLSVKLTFYHPFQK